jgi:hypothetical protein
MIADIKLLQGLLEKYRVTEPVPAAVRVRVIAGRRRNLVVILKKLDRYNPLLGAILLVYFLFKKLGLSVSLVQSAVVFFTVTALSVAGVTTGSYIVVKRVIDSSPKVELQNDEGSVTIETSPRVVDTVDSAKTGEESTPVLREVKNVIHLQPFEGMDAQGSDVTLVSNAIQSELVRLRGSKNILSGKASSHVNRLLLLGTVRKHASLYAITAKVVDGESGRIRFAATEEAKSDSLVSISKKLAKEISDNIE